MRSTPRTKTASTKENGKFTVISLFSGAMGLDIGLEKTEKFKLLACVEKDENALETIRLNRDLGNLHVKDLKLYGDIKKITPHEVLNDLGLKTGQVDLLVGGPPCQSFSTAGRRGTTQDARGTLIWDFLRFVEGIKPKYFLMENVRGLLSAALVHRPIAKRGEGNKPLAPEEEPGSVVNLLLSDFERAGYRVDVFEVNAVNYGAPQLRERVLFIGNNYDRIVNFPEPTHFSSSTCGKWSVQSRLIEEGTAAPMPFKTLGDALKGLKDDDPEIMDFSPRKKGYLSKVPPGGNWRTLPLEQQKESMGKAFFAKGGRSGWWRRLSLDLPCPCLLTLPNHASTALCHPSEVRALSIKEYARVQEFPDEWQFVGSTADKYRQVGNAVPVRLGLIAGQVIAKEMELTNAQGCQRVEPGYKVKPSNIKYIKSHVRTRQWYKDGKAVVNGSNGE